MSWVIPYGASDFKWKDFNRYMLIDIRDTESYNARHIPFAINVDPSLLYNEDMVDISDPEVFEQIKRDTLLATPDASITPIYGDLDISCDKGALTQDALIKGCRADYTYFKISIVTSTYDFQGKIPVIISHTCEDSILPAMNIMRVLNSPVIVLRGGMLEWVKAGLPVV